MDQTNEASRLIDQITSTHVGGRRLTQSWIARELGVYSQTVTRWKTGESIPHTDNLRKLRELAGRVENLTPISLVCDDVAEAVYAVCQAHRAQDAKALAEALDLLWQTIQTLRRMLAETFPALSEPVVIL
jgi:transcriptional regulator with XRE-family HTH domain